MKKIKVSIVNPTTLRLDEEGQVGDIIDLRELQSDDQSFLIDAINQSRDETYEKLLEKNREQQQSLTNVKVLEVENNYKLQLEKMNLEKQRLEDLVKSLDKKIEEEAKTITSNLKTQFVSEKSQYEIQIAQIQKQLESKDRKSKRLNSSHVKISY